jgi:hypothetical protein
MIEVFILCRNRPLLAKICIQSVLLQVKKNYKIIISDNSTNTDVHELCKNYFPTLEYRRRDNLPVMNHFEICSKEANEKYYCLFHDDDIMLPYFTYYIDEAIALFPEASAFGVNSYVLNIDNTLRERYFFTYNKFIKISKEEFLTERYFNCNTAGFAPFPGYVYKKLHSDKIAFPTLSGKNADFIWLINLLKIAPIVWINKSLMIYHYHDNNISNFEVIKDRLSLLAFIKNNLSVKSVFFYRSFIARTLLPPNRRKVFFDKYKFKYLQCYIFSYIKLLSIRFYYKLISL